MTGSTIASKSIAPLGSMVFGLAEMLTIACVPARADAADVACADLDVLLCEGFEASAPGDAPSPGIWKLELGEGSTIVVDGETSAQGKNAARVTVSQGRKWAYMQTRSIFPMAETRMWGRLHFNIRDDRPENEELVHWNLIEAMSGTKPFKMYRYGSISVPSLGRNHFNWNHEMRPRPDGFNELSQDDAHTSRVPTGEWICVEWMFDADADESRFFWNGAEREELHVVGRAGGVAFDMVPFEALNVGFTVYQPIAADYVVWIDEIAIDHERIGCLN